MFMEYNGDRDFKSSGDDIISCIYPPSETALLYLDKTLRFDCPIFVQLNIVMQDHYFIRAMLMCIFQFSQN